MSTSVDITPSDFKMIQSTSSTSWAEASAGHALGVSPTLQAGASFTSGSSLWLADQLFLTFSLASIPSNATITGVVFKYTQAAGTNTGQNVFLAYNDTWTLPVITSYWRTGHPSSGLLIPATDSGAKSVTMPGTYTPGGVVKVFMGSDAQLTGASSPGSNAVIGVGSPKITVTYTLPAPTLTSVSPDATLPAGGGTLTLTGSNFAQPGAGTTTVVIGGNNATSVHVVNDTTITCVAPAHAAGEAQITVTNSNGSSTAFVFLFYVGVKDNSVKLVKAGVVAGSEMADTVTLWPLDDGVASYGASDNLQGLTLTDSDVNGSGFGLAISALVPNNNQAMVDYATLTVYYTTAAGGGQASYLVGLHVDTDRETTTPEIYKLPHGGFTVGQDGEIDKAQSDASFFTSRLFSPSRNVLKTYRTVEFWAELDPETNTPGLQVWAYVDGSAGVQLLDGDGNAATVMPSGFHRLYFPATEAAVGAYVQIEFRVPALGTGQVPVAVAVRDVALRASLRPVKTEVVSARLVLGAGEHEDRGSMRNTVKRQRAALEALLGPDATPEPFRDPVSGENGYMELVGLAISEAVNPGESEPTLVADVQLRRTYYGD